MRPEFSRFPLLLALVLLVTGAAARPRETFSEPPVLRSRDGVLSLRLTARIDPHSAGPTFFYFTPVAPFWLHDAPTLEVRPGERIRIDYRNSLPPIASDDAHGLPDDTNLHFHGLTTSPNAPGDDVLTTMLSPLAQSGYDVKVAADQPPGIYWYHPHAHHETSWQVGNGMSGAIVVDGIENAVPSVAGLRERLIVVRQTFLHPDSDGAVTLGRRMCGLAHLTPRARIAFLRAAFRKNPTAAAADDESKNTVVSLNGAPAGSVAIGIRPGERELFRVVNATPSRNLALAVDGESLELVSEDGVPLRYLPGSVATLSVARLIVPPGGRAEFVVRGRPGGTTLRSLRFDSGPKGDPDPPLTLASLIDDGVSFSADPRVPAPSVQPRPERDYYRTAPPAPVARRVVRLGENDAGSRFFINKRSFDERDAPLFVARSGTVEEWTLQNLTQEVHTFHTHQVHFVVERENGVLVPPARRHWLDTFNVPYERNHRPGSVQILVDFRDPVVRGTFVFHCHILDHEDGGMMAKVRVV
ncbi:MAG: multicopper oxidase family protein [Candidatus Eremiobacteraeota bacterium]|nr:multicopper oxidase family protein [Candidatus Eremiobacteraeota bacterium]